MQVELSKVLLRLHDGEPFRVRLEHPVLDAVVHHLHEVPSAWWPDMQKTVGWRKRVEDGAPVVDVFFLAAGHQAVPNLETPDTAAGSSVDEADAPLGAARRASNGVV